MHGLPFLMRGTWALGLASIGLPHELPAILNKIFSQLMNGLTFSQVVTLLVDERTGASFEKAFDPFSGLKLAF